MRGRRAIDDDVRSSLDLLDGVIGEFDDGLTSSAESEATHRRRSLGRDGLGGSRLSINEQIDDIFSQLTEEIYTEEKKVPKKAAVVSRSPTRGRFDPLPIPPSTATHPPPIDRRKKPGQRSPSNGRREERLGDKREGRGGRNSSLPAKHSNERGEVVVYGSEQRRDGRSLEKVTAEVHKPRAGGSGGGQQPPPKPEKQKIHLKHASTERRPDGGRRERSRSSQGRPLTHQEQAVIRELRERVGGSGGKVSKFDDGNKRNLSLSRGERYVQTSSGKREARNDDDLTIQSREGRAGQRKAERHVGSNYSQKSDDQSNLYESLRGSNITRAESKGGSSGGRGGREGREGRYVEGRGGQDGKEGYSRSRSMGPLQGRMESPERSSIQRTRSRAGAQEDYRYGRGPSQQRYADQLERTRSKSRGRREVRESSGTGRGHPSGGEDTALRSRSRGRSPQRPSDYERQQRGTKPPTPEEAQALIEKMLPRYPYAIPPERQRSMIDLRVTDDYKVNQRRSMAVGPYEDLPPHLRNHLMPPGVTEVPSHIDEQLRFQHQMNIEAQREMLVHRGFPISHPLVSGEIPLHPELLGQLHFDVPSRTTLPLSPEDYRRFLPEQRRTGMQSAFPLGVLPDPQDKKVSRQQSSRRETSNNRENSFVSLPFEDMQRKKTNSRSKSSDSRESKPKPFSLFQGGPGRLNTRRESAGQVDQHWIMKEKHELKSLPSLTHTDAGNNNMTRNDKKRASFGMILKDKFQRNPNMYFPDTQNNNTKLSEKLTKTDSLSDTDTLIHNMSEGSFDKSSHNSNSIGSNKSCSSGKSSVSHDSMNGTPRMRRKAESITTPTDPAPTALLLPSNPSVILNKKTIRNYTPTESTNMLRQFEGGYRQHSLERNAKGAKTQAAAAGDSNLGRKSSMEQLIEDFHKNLPPPPPVTRNTETSLPFSDGDSMFSGPPESSLSDPRTHQVAAGGGTVTSQTSNWSVASSVASFDYHSVNSIDKRKAGGVKRREQMNLPSLTEVDRESPKGERVPPEGAPSPNPTLQRGKERDRDGGKASQVRSSGKEAVADLMKSTENDEELSMLHKLISEGRISGLNEKPPMFTPPTPPSKGTKTRTASGSPASRTRVLPQGPSSNKSSETPPSKNPGSPTKSRTSSSVPPKSSPSARSGERPRKNREAPKPPTQPFKPPPATNEIKFISGRRINSEESVNDAGDESWRGGRPKKEGRSGSVQRSTSMHNTRGESLPQDDHDRGCKDENTVEHSENCDAGEGAFHALGSNGVFPMQPPLKMLTSVIAEKNSTEEIAQDAALAQLIADSTEKKFKLNSLFKGMWKKKHYSFDLS